VVVVVVVVVEGDSLTIYTLCIDVPVLFHLKVKGIFSYLRQIQNKSYDCLKTSIEITKKVVN